MTNTRYKCEYFSVKELVPKHVYADRGERAWDLLEPNALRTLDALRTAYGPITINNWAIGGDRQWSGLRTDKAPVGTAYSQHQFGRAFDCLFNNITAEAVRVDILANPDKFPFINSLELGTSWLHFDTRNCDRILTYSP